MWIVNIVNFDKPVPAAKFSFIMVGRRYTSLGLGALEGRAKNDRRALVRCDGALMAASGNQEQVSSSEKAAAERDDSCDDLKNRELGHDVGLAVFLHEPPVDAEPIASDQVFRISLT